jgi:hypothetical protein
MRPILSIMLRGSESSLETSLDRLTRCTGSVHSRAFSLDILTENAGELENTKQQPRRTPGKVKVVVPADI